MEWTYRLSPAVTLRREPDGSAALISLSPLAVRRLPAAVAGLLERCDGTRTAADLAAELSEREPSGIRAILEELAARNVLLRETPRGAACPEGGEWPTVSVIIPVRNRAGPLADCLRSLGALRYPRNRLEVIVVDDASTDGTPDVARAHGARLIAMDGSAGVSASRNAGVRAATGEIVAFTDSDCVVSPDWLRELVPAFSDPRVAIVGGHVAGPGGTGVLDRYEEAFSPLCMGDRVAELGVGRPVPYVATCNALFRRSAFLAEGGFDEGLRVGEDVDLCWRLLARGWRGLYIPAGRIIHRHRTRLWPFLLRRAQYATSEAWLEAHHPAALKRISLAGWHLALLGAVTAALLLSPALAPLAAGLVLLLHFADRFAALARLGAADPALALRLVGRVHLAAAGTIAAIISRYYLLPLLLLGLWFPAAFFTAAASWLISGGLDYIAKRPRLDPVRYLVVRLLEMAAYQIGVYYGCTAHRNPSPVFVSLRVSYR